jgi:mono/diheme cytochrome c family protein
VKRFAVIAMLLAAAACAKGEKSANSAATAAAVAANPASASDGATVYLADCSSCHQSDGTGVANAFPPLAGNPAVTGDPVAAIAIVKDGLTGRLIVNHAAYSGIMPAWKGQISDEQIAQVLSYIRSSWGNHAPGVSIAQVESVK